MFFKKKNESDPRRVRQPTVGGATPVFSYHAQSARSEPTGVRRATKLFWTSSADGKPLPRRDPRKLPRRVLGVSLIILVVALALNSLFLGREPVVVVHTQADGRQLLLRSQETYQKAAQQVLGSSFANSNKLTINTDKIAKEVQAQFPELGAVTVVLPFIGRQAAVHIQTSRPALLLSSGQAGGVFLVDESGRAMMDASKVPVSVKEQLPVVQDQSGMPVSVGDSVLPKDDVDFITEVIGQLAAKNIKVSAMTLPAGGSELDVFIEGASYFVKYNLRGDARVAVGSFLAVKQHLEREGKTPGSYIDVRVENKAYYR